MSKIESNESELKSGGEDYWKKPFYLKLWMMNARVRQFQKVFLEAKNPKFKEIDPENWRPKS